jgi:hypothetical protein
MREWYDEEINHFSCVNVLFFLNYKKMLMPLRPTKRQKWPLNFLVKQKCLYKFGKKKKRETKTNQKKWKR